MVECQDSPDGKHSFAPDYEYDASGQSVNCEYCGEIDPAASKRDYKSERLGERIRRLEKAVAELQRKKGK